MINKPFKKIQPVDIIHVLKLYAAGPAGRQVFASAEVIESSTFVYLDRKHVLLYADAYVFIYAICIDDVIILYMHFFLLNHDAMLTIKYSRLQW